MAVQQIMFFAKNKIDLSNSDIEITITDAVATNTGEAFINFIRNRNNSSAWLTTDSTDAANTQMDIDLADDREVSEIILIGHNFKAFTIQYWDGLVYTDFSTAISETTNSDGTTHFSFTEVNTSKIRIIITGTQVADADKQLKQLIITEKIGTSQLEGWPTIKKPTISLNKIKTRMLSGKVNIVDNVGSFSATLSVVNWSSSNDMDILEDIYFRRQGVLVWLCGGLETQFTSVRIGYRLEDIYFVRPTNEWKPEWAKGLYKSGMKIEMKLEEAID